MKKRFSTLIICFVMLCSTSAFAAAPLLLAPFIYWSAIAHVAVGAAIYANAVFARGDRAGTSQQAGDSKVSASSGAIGRNATVQWVDLSTLDADGMPQVSQKDVTIKVPYDSLKSAVRSNPSKYPKLDAATRTQSNLPQSMGGVNDVPASNTLWTNILYSSKTYTLGQYTHSTTGGCTNVCQPADAETQYYLSGEMLTIIKHGNYGVSDTWIYWFRVPVTPVYADSTPSQYSQNLSGVSTGVNNVFSDKYAEIDDYIKEFPGNVSILDSPDNSTVDSASSASLPTPSTQEAVNSAVNTAANKAAVTAANNAVSTAQNNYNSNPTAENAQALANAQSQAASALANSVNNAANTDPAPVNDAASSALGSLPTNTYDSTVENVPEKKSISSLLSSLADSSPLGSMVRTFSVSTSSPQAVFNIGTVYGKELKFDFTPWQSYLEMCGAALVLIAHGFAVLIVIRGW